MKTLGLLLALALALTTSSLLTACGTEVVDLRGESGDEASGGSGVAPDPPACSGSACDAVEHPPRVSAGLMHACAVTRLGAVKCWGSNISGQLGDGSLVDSHAPVDVVGLSSGVIDISVGDSYTCAVTHTGALLCWGADGQGQLGDHSTTDSYVPVPVAGLSSGVRSVSTGASHTCAVTHAGAVLCWGTNSNGQLGDHTTVDSLAVVGVIGLSSGVAAVAAGGNHTCALTTAGAVKCWGDGHQGELGNKSQSDSSVPVDVLGLSSGVVAIAAGREHTCAVTQAGALQCWGWNVGQIGDGTATNRLAPVDVAGLSSGVAAVSAGVVHTCAVTKAGAVLCWGLSFLGQLGDGKATDSYVPVDVVGLSSGAGALSAGAASTCAVTKTGAIVGWGSDLLALGQKPAVFSPVPVEVTGL